MKEIDEIRQYLRDHLQSSHGYSKAEVYALSLVLLMERHMELHP